MKPIQNHDDIKDLLEKRHSKDLQIQESSLPQIAQVVLGVYIVK